MSFLLPGGLAPEALRELERACVSGGPDNMPWPTQVQVASQQMTLRRHVDESGTVFTPWLNNGSSLLAGTTATLMEREAPYRLAVELARGKVNQLRTQAWEWRNGGLQMPSTLEEHIRQASHSFGRALTAARPEEADEQAQIALNLAYQAADQLVQGYTEQVFQVRRQRQPRLETMIGCRLGPSARQDQVAEVITRTCNSVCLPLTWKNIEPVEGGYRWDLCDELLDWAEAKELTVFAGPLIDFAAMHLPEWLWLWERDLGSVARFMENFVANTVQRYRDRIRWWQLTSASNFGSALSLGEDELLWLTVRLAEIARQIDPQLKLVVSIAQPWGEYMAQEDRTHSPFLFADTLIRSGVNLAALDLELVMGVAPRGSYGRDLLDISRLLDLYAILGLPLRLTLGYPSSSAPDPRGDGDSRVDAGYWRGGISVEGQADWTASVAQLAACKPFVQGIQWIHLNDADPHQFPHCGLLDEHGQPKPACEQFQRLREKHLQ